jgi:folate-dependent phosphoribosylglycinamide formyltransferase PurN
VYEQIIPHEVHGGIDCGEIIPAVTIPLIHQTTIESLHQTVQITLILTEEIILLIDEVEQTQIEIQKMIDEQQIEAIEPIQTEAATMVDEHEHHEM